jgi:hypothetical protein
MDARLIERGNESAVFDPVTDTLFLDLSRPRMLKVLAVNELTGIRKEYILKVNAKGVCLV